MFIFEGPSVSTWGYIGYNKYAFVFLLGDLCCTGRGFRNGAGVRNTIFLPLHIILKVKTKFAVCKDPDSFKKNHISHPILFLFFNSMILSGFSDNHLPDSCLVSNHEPVPVFQSIVSFFSVNYYIFYSWFLNESAGVVWLKL